MKRLLVVAVAACAAITLPGCAGLASVLSAPVGKDSTMGQAILQNLETCRRSYRGALGAGVTGSFEIECPAQAVQSGSQTGF